MKTTIWAILFSLLATAMLSAQQTTATPDQVRSQIRRGSLKIWTGVGAIGAGTL